MIKNTLPKKKKLKDRFFLKPKYFIVFFMVCIVFLVILAAIVRATQLHLIKASRDNTQQLRTMSLKLEQLQQQQNQYQRWWTHERANKMQNVLYDVLYKIKLANLYASLGENSSALQLLKNTQSILDTLNNEQIDLLKQQVIKTIEYLNQLAHVDINKTILTLDTTIQTIEILPVLNGYNSKKNTKTVLEQKNEKPSSTPQSHFWNSILKQLKQLVVIHRTKKGEGVFFKENALLIKQMIIQKLLQAQQALLINDFTLYQHNINIAMTWLKEYCSKDKAKLQAIIKTLTNLNAYKIELKNQSVDFFKLIKTTEKTIHQFDPSTTLNNTQPTPSERIEKLYKTSFLSPTMNTLS